MTILPIILKESTAVCLESSLVCISAPFEGWTYERIMAELGEIITT